jgi:hypothetical protein
MRPETDAQLTLMHAKLIKRAGGPKNEEEVAVLESAAKLVAFSRAAEALHARVRAGAKVTASATAIVVTPEQPKRVPVPLTPGGDPDLTLVEPIVKQEVKAWVKRYASIFMAWVVQRRGEHPFVGGDAYNWAIDAEVKHGTPVAKMCELAREFYKGKPLARLGGATP